MQQVRAACSPDAATHLSVHEPQACAYVAVLFTPALCSVPGFQPRWEGAAAQGGLVVATALLWLHTLLRLMFAVQLTVVVVCM